MVIMRLSTPIETTKKVEFEDDISGICGVDAVGGDLDEEPPPPPGKRRKVPVVPDAAPSGGGGGGGAGGGGGPRLQPGHGMGLRVDFGEEIGHIRWYPWTGRFEVTCTRLCHRAERCRITKYNTESTGIGDAFNPALGRPLGLIAAWILCDFCGEPHEHKSPWHALSITRAERIAGINHLLELPNGAEMVCYERPQRTGEPVEPVGDS